MEKLLIMATLVSNPRGASSKEIAEQLQVCRRTVAEYRDFLRDRLFVNLEMVDQEGKPAPQHGWGLAVRWRATNAEEILPVIKTLRRFVV